jgi:dienelactone hydrolase
MSGAAQAMTEEAVTFASGGEQLVGVLAPAASDASLGAVIVHGWSSYRSGPHNMLVKLARALAAAGVPALRFDLRGRGDSTGEYGRTNLDAMIDDTISAGRWLQQRSGCTELAGVGLCSGGNVVIGAATLEPAFVRLVPISTLPFQPQKQSAGKWRRRCAMAGSYARKALRWQTWRKILRGEVNYGKVGQVLRAEESAAVGAGGENLKDSARDIMEALKAYAGDMLFIHGQGDAEAVAAREHYQSFAQAHGLNAAFHLVTGANHNFYRLAWERELIEVTVQTLTRPRHRS